MRKMITACIVSIGLLSSCQHAHSNVGAKNALSPPASKVEPAVTASVAMRQSTTPYSWCPLLVRGTRVEVEQLPDGAAFVFHTNGDLGAVRARVSEMAYFHDQMVAAEGPEHLDQALLGPADSGPVSSRQLATWATDYQPSAQQRLDHRAMLAARVEYEDTLDGARLALTAKIPWDIPLIQQFVSERAHHMMADHCAVMGKPWPEPHATS
jgi:hypothetical protein